MLTCSLWTSGEAVVDCSYEALGRFVRNFMSDSADFVELSGNPDPLLEIFMRLFKVTIIVLEYIFPIIAVVVW